MADTFNHRVFRFDSISTKINGAPANGVLGQSNFTTAIGSLSVVTHATAPTADFPLCTIYKTL